MEQRATFAESSNKQITDTLANSNEQMRSLRSDLDLTRTELIANKKQVAELSVQIREREQDKAKVDQMLLTLETKETDLETRTKEMASLKQVIYQALFFYVPYDIIIYNPDNQ